MEIRLAIKEDLPELLRMGEAFYTVSGYKDDFEFDTNSLKILFIELIKQKCLLTDGSNGLIGFTVFPLFFNHKVLLSQELLLWVDYEKRNTKLGFNLLKAAEKQSKLLGAVSMIMIGLNSLELDKIDKLYNKMGYKKTEQSYIRRL